MGGDWIGVRIDQPAEARAISSLFRSMTSLTVSLRLTAMKDAGLSADLTCSPVGIRVRGRGP